MKSATTWAIPAALPSITVYDMHPRRALKELVDHDEIPDYHLEIDQKGVNLFVTPKKEKK